MKTAAIYARVSTEMQEQNGTSLETQVQACRKYALEHGFAIIEEVRESKSGKNLDRPGLMRIRTMAHEEKVDAIIVYDLDRLSRDLADTLLIMREFERSKGEVHFVTIPQDGSIYGSMFVEMRAVLAKMERTSLLDRFRRGKRQRSQEGKIIGSGYSPFGFQYVRGEGRFEPIETELHWVREMFRWLVDERCSLARIAQRLIDNRVPTKRGAERWARATVLFILKNPLYIGEYYWSKTDRNNGKKRTARPVEEWVSVPLAYIEPIISREQWEAAQAQLQRNQKLALRNTKHSYMLRGMMSCGSCGYCFSPVRASSGVQYRCNNRYQYQLHLPLDQRCPVKVISAERLELIVWDEVIRQVSEPDVIMGAFMQQASNAAQEQAALDQRLAELHRIEETLNRKSDRLVSMFLDGKVDEATYDRQFVLIKSERESINQAIAEAQDRSAQQSHVVTSVEGLEYLCAGIRECLPFLTMEDKRDFLEALNVQVRVSTDRVEISGLLQEVVLSVVGSTATYLRKVPEQTPAPCHPSSGPHPGAGRLGAGRCAAGGVQQA